jgi:hypothetical protein
VTFATQRRGGLRELGVAFNAATALFALPLYVPLYASPGVVDLARLVLTVQVLPALAMFALGHGIRAVFGAGLIWRAYWITVTIAALASFFRLWQRQVSIGFPNAPDWIKVAAVGMIAPLVIALAATRADWLPRGFGRVAPLTAVVCAVFVLFLQLSPPVAGSSDHKPDVRRDTVFIFIFDELGRQALERDGKIDPVLFPNFAGLAEDGVWVADGTSNYSPSCQAIPAILSGREQPRCDESFLAGAKATLLANLATAFELRVYGEYLRGCPDGAETCKGIPYLTARYPVLGIANHLFPQSIRLGLKPLDSLAGRDANPYTLALWSDFLDDVRTLDLEGRAFFVHLNLPHSPYAYRANGTLGRLPSRLQYFYGTEEDANAYDNYREQVRFVDSLLGSFVAVLRERNVYGGASIFVTGDHGPRLQIPPKTSTLSGIAAQTPNVPVIMKSPQLQPLARVGEYQHIDFAPTILEILGLMSTERFDGRSIMTSSAPARQKWFVTGDRKYFREPDARWLRYDEVVPWPMGLSPR